MEYDERTKDELQDELERRDLPKSGTKAELIERLEDDDADREIAPEDRGDPSTNGGRRRRLGAAEAARRAAEQLGLLRGRPVEGVSGFQRTEDGWRVLVEMVEVSRVPASTDVIGAYEVTLDADGELVGYERVRRYGRTQTGEDAL